MDQSLKCLVYSLPIHTTAPGLVQDVHSVLSLALSGQGLTTWLGYFSPFLLA